MTPLEQANETLRRLTPGSLEAGAPGGIARMVGGTWVISVDLATRRPYTEAELRDAIADIERAYPITDSERLKICRALLQGWREEEYSGMTQRRKDVAFFAPDCPHGFPPRDHADWIDAFSIADGKDRLTLVDACERALRRYEARWPKGSVKSSEQSGRFTVTPGAPAETVTAMEPWPGLVRTRCSACGAPNPDGDCACDAGRRFVCAACWPLREHPFSDWCKRRWAETHGKDKNHCGMCGGMTGAHNVCNHCAHRREKAGEAPVSDGGGPSAAHACLVGGAWCSTRFAGSPVPKRGLVGCAECRAPLTPAQQRTDARGRVVCRLCAVRLGS